jgi:hypothetical protein
LRRDPVTVVWQDHHLPASETMQRK